MLQIINKMHTIFGETCIYNIDIFHSFANLNPLKFARFFPSTQWDLTSVSKNNFEHFFFLGKMSLPPPLPKT